MFEGGHGLGRRIGKGRQRAGQRDRALIVDRVRGGGAVSLVAKACRQTPCIRAIAFEMAWVIYNPRPVDQRYVAVVCEIGSSVCVAQLVRIKTHERVMRKEQRAAAAHAHVKLDAVIAVAIGIMVALFLARPAGAIIIGALILPGPAGVIETGGDGMGGRGDPQKIDHHSLVEANQRMVNLKAPLRRPVPIERRALVVFAKPVPLNAFPKSGDPPVKRPF